MTDTPEFRFDAGEEWLDLLGTRRSSWSARPVERIPDPAALERWLHHGRVAVAPATAAHVHLARELRESLRRLATDLLGLPAATAAPDPTTALTTVNRFAAGAGGIQARWQHGKLIAARRQDPEAVLCLLAAQGLLRMIDGPQLLRSCEDDTCRKVYLDERGSRKFCCDTCSSRSRVRAHRERARANEAVV